MALVELIALAKCRTEGGTFVAWKDRELAVFVTGDPPGVAILDNACPHSGGNLSGGPVKEGVVQCPWHQWEFRLVDGVCTHSDRAVVRRYPAEVRDGVVWFDPDAGGLTATAPQGAMTT